MDEAGGYFLYGEDKGSFIGNGDILEGADLFYSAGACSFKRTSSLFLMSFVCERKMG